MTNLVIFFVVVVLVTIIFLSREDPTKKDNRKIYRKALVKFLEAEVEDSEEYENSYRISFNYEGKEFVYEDIEETIFKKTTHRALLKGKTTGGLILSFTEKPRGDALAKLSSLEDMKNPWAKNAKEVRVPRELKEYDVFTNNSKAANQVLSDEQIVRIFKQFKNIDHRGHPVMSLEIVPGIVRLKIHPPGELKPNLFDLQGNVSLIESYLGKMKTVVTKLDSIIYEE